MIKIFWIVITLIFIAMILNASWLYYQNNKIPTLGISDGKLTKMPKTSNAVSSQTNDITKQVDPFVFNGDLEQSKRKMIKLISSIKGAVLLEQESHYLYFVFQSNLMRFNDDVEFYFDEEKQIIDFRSASRAGTGDLGKNRQRYEFIKSLWAE